MARALSPRRRSPRRRGRGVAGALLAAACCSCGGDAGLREPPSPPLGELEPLLAERIREATQAVRERPRSAEAWGRLGEVYDVNSFEGPALLSYARAAELDPDEWRWPYFEGIVLGSGDPARSLERLSRAAELEPGYVPLRVRLGLARYLAEDFDEAERQLRRALELDPGAVNARIVLARIAVARGDPRSALVELERADEVAHGEGAVHVHLAQVYRELGRHAEAEREEALTADAPHPARPDGLVGLVDPVRDEVKQRESVRSTRQLAEARRHFLEGRDDQGAQALERALAADPDSVTALIVSARVLAARGELEPARQRLERALALGGDEPDTLVDLGTVHALAGRIGPAIEALERALELDPRRPGLRLALAGLLVQADRAPRALELLREARRLQPDDRQIRDRLATVLVDSGRLAEAIELLGDPETTPDDPTLRRRLAWALATCPDDRLRDGKRALELALALGGDAATPRPEVLDARAAARAETGDFAGAATDARAAQAAVERSLAASDAAVDPRRRRRLEELAGALRERLSLYERGLPYREGGGDDGAAGTGPGR